MRLLGLLLAVSVPFVQVEQTEAPPAPKPVATMSELMVKVIYPTSDAIFYIARTVPRTEAKWNELQGKALMLAESANLLMMPGRMVPGRGLDPERWMQDAKLLLDAGTAAYKAAKRKDSKALIALNQQLYASCVTCHADYRPNYRPRLP